MERLTAWSPRILSILRIVAGLLFLNAGTMKVLHFPPPPPEMAQHAGLMETASGWIELIGGALMVLGLFTRPVAFLLSGEMAIAYWTVHARMSPFPALNMGSAAILFCFIYLYLVFAGAGPWSVDAMMDKRRA